MQTIELEQRTPAWHAYRKTRIGASDAPVVMGVSPYATRLQLWEEKVLDKRRSENAGMSFGKEREEFVRQIANCKFGTEFVPLVGQSDTNPWMFASFDGIDSKNRAIEIKCANKEDHETAVQKKVPAHYVPQLQHQLFVAQLDSMMYASYHKDEMVIVEVERDRDYQDLMISCEKEFLGRMLDLDAPAPCERDRIQIAEQWVLDDLKLMKEFKALEDANKERRKRVIDHVKGFGRDVETVLGKITRGWTKGAVQYDMIPELAGVDLELYRKEPFEKFTFSFGKGCEA